MTYENKERYDEKIHTTRQHRHNRKLYVYLIIKCNYCLKYRKIYIYGFVYMDCFRK